MMFKGVNVSNLIDEIPDNARVKFTGDVTVGRNLVAMLFPHLTLLGLYADCF
jgi:hypothetical protein